MTKAMSPVHAVTLGGNVGIMSPYARSIYNNTRRLLELTEPYKDNYPVYLKANDEVVGQGLDQTHSIQHMHGNGGHALTEFEKMVTRVVASSKGKKQIRPNALIHLLPVFEPSFEMLPVFSDACKSFVRDVENDPNRSNDFPLEEVKALVKNINEDVDMMMATHETVKDHVEQMGQWPKQPHAAPRPDVASESIAISQLISAENSLQI